MKRYKLTIEYDGTDYAGWQYQPDISTVQGSVQKAIFGFCQQQVVLTCAGRTDAGVHAWGQVVHVDIAGDHSAFRVKEAVNAHLRREAIAVVAAEEVDAEFSARFDAKRRYYHYRIIQRRAPLVLEARRAWQVAHPLDVEAMREGAKHLLGHHDFSSFRDAQCQSKSPMRTLDALEITQQGNEVSLHLNALSFLHHQVRIITGTLAEIGWGKRDANSMPALLASACRANAGATAPACGLYFVKVDY